MMYIKNKYIILIYRILFLIICGYGLYLNFFDMQLQNRLELLSYYTILSNIACFLYFFVVVIKTAINWEKAKQTYYPVIKGMVTMGITVTFLIFHFILRPSFFVMNNNSYFFTLANTIVHYIVPIMVVLDYVLFDKKGHIGRSDPLKWLLMPLVYWLLCLIRALFGFTYSTGSKYPYFFIDINEYGLIMVLRNVALLVLFFTLLGYAFLLFDKLLNKLSMCIKKQKE